MNIDLQMAVDGYKTLLILKPDLYDGHPPIDSISYQTRMRVLDPNVCAVSAAISLQNYVSESLNYHLPVQVHVADAIEDFQSNRRFRVSPIEQNPAKMLVGNRKVFINTNNTVSSSDASNVQFSLGDSHSFTSFASIHSVHISSNISCFFPNDDKGSLLSSIAAAVFVAPDYAFGEICLGKECADLLCKCEYKRYQTLLGSINLKLSVEE